MFLLELDVEKSILCFFIDRDNMCTSNQGQTKINAWHEMWGKERGDTEGGTQMRRDKEGEIANES